MSKVFAASPLYLNVQLESESIDKYVRAELYNKDQQEIAGSPVTMTHTAKGLYQESSFVMPSLPKVVAIFRVYEDDQYSIPSEEDYVNQSEFELDTSEQTQLVDSVYAEIDDSDSFVAEFHDENVMVGEIEDDDYEAQLDLSEEYSGEVEDNDHYQGEITCQ